jgi:hypothetical protein
MTTIPSPPPPLSSRFMYFYDIEVQYVCKVPVSLTGMDNKILFSTNDVAVTLVMTYPNCLSGNCKEFLHFDILGS